MVNFNQFLLEGKENKNLHLVHIEDQIMNFGIDGGRAAINFLRSLRDMLAGGSRSSVNMTVKWDGCIHEDTKIVTNIGIIPIKDLIERFDHGENIKVVGRDFSHSIPYDKSIEIENTSISENDKDWVKVTLENGNSFTLTSDHEVYTNNRGWVEAKDLTEDDDILEL